MGQSPVEIKHYSVGYFDRVTAFEVLWRRTSLKAGAHMLCVNVSGIYASMQCVSAPPLTEVPCYSASNMVVQSIYATE